MNINTQNSINFSSRHHLIKRLKHAAVEKFSQVDNIGEGTNIALDFAGKAALVPATIMIASKEDKEKKQYSALKNPIAATLQLMMEVPILMWGSKLVEKLANQGKLDKPESGFSYNEKLYKDEFISALNQAAKTDENFSKKTPELLERLNKKGLGKNLKEDFVELIESSAEDTAKTLKKSLDNYDGAHKRLYHLQNRICFAAAIVLTPLLCKAEDYFFPKIMKKIKPAPKKEGGRRIISFHHFKTHVLKRGEK